MCPAEDTGPSGPQEQRAGVLEAVRSSKTLTCSWLLLSVLRRERSILEAPAVCTQTHPTGPQVLGPPAEPPWVPGAGRKHRCRACLHLMSPGVYY